MAPRVVVVGLASDFGCQVQMTNIEDHLLDVLGLIDLAYWQLASRTICMSSLNELLSSPLGPFTVTVEPSIFTSTPDGTGMGCLPIRDTAVAPFSVLSVTRCRR